MEESGNVLDCCIQETAVSRDVLEQAAPSP